jgi:hypothetical protein
MSVLLPSVLQGRAAGGIDSLHPADAVRELDRHVRSTGLTIALVRDCALGGLPGFIDQDDLGPGMLGLLGYNADARKVLRSGAPGHLWDHQHGRHALASTLFITGDVRLGRRVEAWAAYTDRGPEHGRGPLVCVVELEDPASFGAAVSVVNALADRFAGRIDVV